MAHLQALAGREIARAVEEPRAGLHMDLYRCGPSWVAHISDTLAACAFLRALRDLQPQPTPSAPNPLIPLNPPTGLLAHDQLMTLIAVQAGMVKQVKCAPWRK